MKSGGADRQSEPLFWLQADPDMPGRQEEY